MPTIDEIVDWVRTNHRHHADGDDQECQCWHSESPYVDSLELEQWLFGDKYEPAPRIEADHD